jgi:cytosine/adenosine deaminase-related metal-dependent hydrolase
MEKPFKSGLPLTVEKWARQEIAAFRSNELTIRPPQPLNVLRTELSIAGKHGWEREQAELALDRLLVDMVTSNPAKALRWQNEVGTIEPGKVADLFIITKPSHVHGPDLPPSPYRTLIDATERDVRLVLVGGDPLVGDRDIMNKLKPGQAEAIATTCAG